MQGIPAAKILSIALSSTWRLATPTTASIWRWLMAVSTLEVLPADWTIYPSFFAAACNSAT
ncbi:MAG TPA: hypothetical protein VNQ74_14595, partial [Burkholderiaceae bacterium]|nr:hypothetical protein [Burkholderiaceae bacterium]